MRTTSTVVRTKYADSSPVVLPQKRQRREALAARRKAIGWSQANLAEALGIAPNTVSRWETGISTPSPWVRDALANALNLSVIALAELIDGKPLPKLSVVPDEVEKIPQAANDETNGRPILAANSEIVSLPNKARGLFKRVHRRWKNPGQLRAKKSSTTTAASLRTHAPNSRASPRQKEKASLPIGWQQLNIFAGEPQWTSE